MLILTFATEDKSQMLVGVSRFLSSGIGALSGGRLKLNKLNSALQGKDKKVSDKQCQCIQSQSGSLDLSVEKLEIDTLPKPVETKTVAWCIVLTKLRGHGNN